MFMTSVSDRSLPDDTQFAQPEDVMDTTRQPALQVSPVNVVHLNRCKH